MKKYVIPVILPYTEQKADWIFDNQRISSQKEDLNKEKLEELIKKHLIKIEEMDEHCFVEVAFVGSDFTNLKENIQQELLETLDDEKQTIEFVVNAILNGEYTTLPDTIANGKVLKILYNGDLKSE